MAKTRLGKIVSQETGLSRVAAEKAVASVFSNILSITEAEDRLIIKNFGVFKMKTISPRKWNIPGIGSGVSTERAAYIFKQASNLSSK